MYLNIHRPQFIAAASTPMRHAMGRTRGFTLVELMVTVAIIGILAAVALPSYAEYTQRGRLTEAFRTLADMQVKLNQYFLDQRSYIGACAAGTLAPLPGSNAYFSYSCPTLTASDFEVDATGRGAMADFSYTLTLSNGSVTKASTHVPSDWATTNASSCWVFKRDGSC